MKKRVWGFIAVGLVFGLGMAQAAETATTTERPNIVLILIDDVGVGWIPPYAERLTPEDMDQDVLHLYERRHNGGTPLDMQAHIEAAKTCMPYLATLARDGAVFDRCYATASLCAPSRAGIMTGTFQQRWGAYENDDIVDFGIPADRVIMAEPLQAAGYRTALIGKWHLAKKDSTVLEQMWTDQGKTGPIPPRVLKRLAGSETAKEAAYRSSSLPGQHPLDRGFDYYFGYNSHDDKYYNSTTLWENHSHVPPRPEGELLTDLFNDKSCEFVASALEEKQPFFLYYAPMTLHGAFRPPPKRYSGVFDTGMPFSNDYAGHLLALDYGIKDIFQLVEKHGQLSNTLFIFSSDNGCTVAYTPPYNSPNRGGKGTGWLGGLNVPLVIWQPGVVKPGINKEIVSLADVMPTVIEAAGAKITEGLDGLSLLPFLRGETPKGPRDELCSSGIHASHWSYFYEGRGEVVQTDSKTSPLYAWKIRDEKLLLRITPTKPGIYKSLPDGLPSRTLFYDLAKDPQQSEGIGGQYPEQVEAFDRGIQQWLRSMEPPLVSQKADYQMLSTGVDRLTEPPGKNFSR